MKKISFAILSVFFIFFAACSVAGPVGKAIEVSDGISIADFCFDDDGGKEAMKEGYLVYKTTLGKQGVHDKCTNEILTEYYCDGRDKKSLFVNCTQFGMICQKGACTPVRVYGTK